eukprot:Polyplicarium_translucidae@DN4264_c0_g1_i1.p2
MTCTELGHDGASLEIHVVIEAAKRETLLLDEAMILSKICHRSNLGNSEIGTTSDIFIRSLKMVNCYECNVYVLLPVGTAFFYSVRDSLVVVCAAAGPVSAVGCRLSAFHVVAPVVR